MKISVITIAREFDESLRKTEASINAQSLSDFEWVVVTPEHASTWTWKGKVPRLGQDQGEGIFQAMNLGSQICNGDWIIFLNAGDTFTASTILQRLQNELDNSTDIIYGYHETEYSFFIRDEYPERIQDLWKGMSISHQSIVARRQWVERFPFRPEIAGISSDYDFLVQCVKSHAVVRELPFKIARMQAHGTSQLRRYENVRGFQKISIQNFPTQYSSLFYWWKIFEAKMEYILRKILPVKCVESIIYLRSRLRL